MRQTPLLLGTLILAACGGTESPTDTGPTGSTGGVPTTITLSASNASLSFLDETQQLTATVRDQNGATMNGAVVSWTSSDGQVATVSVAGLVTAVENGSATVTASLGSASPGTALVTVLQKAFTITLAPNAQVLIGPGDVATVTADVRDAGDSRIVNPTITWTSSDVDVVTINESGIATSVAPGVVLISALATDGGATVLGLAEFAVYDSLRITTNSLNNGVVGNSYEQTLGAIGGGGDGLYVWSLFSGFLPTGLQLDSSGVITGTPTTLERTTFVVEVTSVGESATRELSIGTCELSFGECR